MVLFLRSKNRFCYIPENESEQDILGWNKSLIPTGEKSKKFFSMPMGDTAAAIDNMDMDHKMRDPDT